MISALRADSSLTVEAAAARSRFNCCTFCSSDAFAEAAWFVIAVARRLIACSASESASMSPRLRAPRITSSDEA